MNATTPILFLALVLPGLALADTTSLRDLRQGMPAVIDGVVERITDDDEFLLADETGSILVYIGPNPMPVRAGDRVRVAGTVDDDGPLELYATEVTLPDGRVVPLPNRD
jgi:uncharacterized protein YdeI (BOF family)